MTTSNNSLGATEISYLENRFFSLANEAHRYKVVNNNEPPKGNVTEEKESELEEFIENARLVMSVLGRRVFEPIVKKSAKQNNLPVTPVTTNVIFLIKQEIKGDKVNARAIRTPEGIVVLSGSKLREKPVLKTQRRTEENIGILLTRTTYFKQISCLILRVVQQNLFFCVLQMEIQNGKPRKELLLVSMRRVID